MKKRITVDLEEWQKFEELERVLGKIDKYFLIKFSHSYGMGEEYHSFSICNPDETTELLEKELKEQKEWTTYHWKKVNDIKEIVFDWSKGMGGALNRSTKAGYQKILNITNRVK